MKIVSISARNFRGLRNITMLDPLNVNVISGPNAIGKSTLLEVIRLPKVILAPRFTGEGNSALQQMGAMSPHQQTIGSLGFDISTLAYDHSMPISLQFITQISQDEMNKLNSMKQDLSMMILRSETIQEGAESPLAFTQFLSTEEGRKKLENRLDVVSEQLKGIDGNRNLNIELVMDHNSRSIRGVDIFSQAVIALLDRQVVNHKTLFSMFPADRAFPTGEQPIQVGAGDAGQTLQSHMSNPTLKYARLKQTIIHHIMLRPDGRDFVSREFNLIFDNLLPGKKLAGILINELGLLKILVQDIDTGKKFDIDQMSSGEKGLVLTFLFLRMSMEKGGIFMLDEPELHLNAAVQNRILGFIKKFCVQELDLQAFVCTHSPEMVRGAYEDDDCRLYHLRAGDDLTPILHQDQNELFEVFERLGSSTADVLFSKGNIYVEGVDDNQILQAGFPDIVSGYKITPLGGRGDVEREFPLLLKEELSGRLKKKALFILDNDRKVTSLKSGAMVKVHQLNRYCMENYLIDADIMYDIANIHAKKDMVSRGKFPQILRELAFAQAASVAMREVYTSTAPESPGMRKEDVIENDIPQTAVNMVARLQRIKDQLTNFDEITWKHLFESKSLSKKSEIESAWDSKWRELCSGKELIDALYIRFGIALKKVEFKKEIIRQMAQKKTDDWNALSNILKSEIS